MRHRVSHRKLGRVTEHRIAMLRNQASALLKYEHIETTMPKAKELRPFVERIITIAKRGLAAGDAERAHAARAPARAARHPGPRRRRASCSTRLRRASRRGRAATRASCGSATAAATAPRSRRSSSSAASTTPTPTSDEGCRRPKPRSRRAWAAACAPRPSGCAARRPTPATARPPKASASEEGQAGAHQEQVRQVRHPRQGQDDVRAAQGGRELRQGFRLRIQAQEVADHARLLS